jgi:hypothetical protein
MTIAETNVDDDEQTRRARASRALMNDTTLSGDYGKYHPLFITVY